MVHTSLVIPELHGLFRHQLISIHLGIEAVEQLQNDRQVARAGVNGAPRRNCFKSVDLRFYVFKVPLAESFNRFALRRVRLWEPGRGWSGSIP